MHKIYYSIIGMLAIIWAIAIGYYLYITGDLMLVLLIVANIVLAYRITIYPDFSESLIQEQIISDMEPPQIDHNLYSSERENFKNQENVVIIL